MFSIVKSPEFKPAISGAAPRSPQFTVSVICEFFIEIEEPVPAVNRPLEIQLRVDQILKRHYLLPQR